MRAFSRQEAEHAVAGPPSAIALQCRLFESSRNKYFSAWFKVAEFRSFVCLTRLLPPCWGDWSLTSSWFKQAKRLSGSQYRIFNFTCINGVFALAKITAFVKFTLCFCKFPYTSINLYLNYTIRNFLNGFHIWLSRYSRRYVIKSQNILKYSFLIFNSLKKKTLLHIFRQLIRYTHTE